ncbi:hypothetical protein GCM10010433_01610 [Streptomyces pulveraceus]
MDAGQGVEGPGHVCAKSGRGEDLGVGAESEEFGEGLFDGLDRDRHPDPAIGVGARGGPLCGIGHGGLPQMGQPVEGAWRQTEGRLALLAARVEEPQIVLPVVGQVEPLGPFEPLIEDVKVHYPRDAVGTEPFGAAGHEVPVTCLEHQPVGFHDPGDLAGFGPAQMAHPHGPVVPHRLRDLAQPRRAVAFPVPRRGVEVEPLGDPAGPVAQLGGQRGHELQLYGRHGRAPAEIGGGRRQPGQEQRVGLVRGQPGQPGAETAEQPVAAVVTGFAVQRHTCRAEGLHVTVDGAHGHLQRVGQLLCCHPFAVLQEQQDGHQSARTHAVKSVAVH